jgi:alpha-galactosidase
VDYLKYDWCDTKGQDAVKSYTLMSESLRASGRPIVFSLCEWGTAKPWTWAQSVGNLWRTTGDICDSWEIKKNAWSTGFVKLLDMNVGLESYAGPGHWNDPDMLEVGNGGMTDEEYRSHFSLWCILAAPLMAGNNIQTMKPEIKNILTNKEVIAVDQDRMGRQGRRVRKDGDKEVWVKPLSDGSSAVILFNRGTSATDITVNWTDLDRAATLGATVRDLWAKKDLGKFTGKFTAKVAPHGVVMVKIKVTP